MSNHVAILICQVLIALGIYNVWILRLNKPSAWRGGLATTMAEEFAVYGLPKWMVVLVGFLKLACATCLLIALRDPALKAIAGGSLGALMLFAVMMHWKAGDEVRRAFPAAAMLCLCLVVTMAGLQS